MLPKVKAPAVLLAVLLLLANLAIAPAQPVQAATYYSNYYAFSR
ncbi:MAG: hypothetical protein PWQ18_1312, partial [Clostridia bacterium]|nr:hypothetical protein [Clostridia bacterium]